ncbi:hypothetical protein RVIR1_08850 [Candidatus Rickettsiella viridis]|uniref:Uncharacterized protein n=1 Tax=Candidatus Rickettsiella viridis TaxID=676208 RepID=A0A2Z5V7I0_9COXI|nr:hypothetical protein RVIR1_08850 [Candidatus Rickettsiella viridis]
MQNKKFDQFQSKTMDKTKLIAALESNSLDKLTSLLFCISSSKKFDLIQP